MKEVVRLKRPTQATLSLYSEDANEAVQRMHDRIMLQSVTKMPSQKLQNVTPEQNEALFWKKMEAVIESIIKRYAGG
jgi:hypothetical protein